MEADGPPQVKRAKRELSDAVAMVRDTSLTCSCLSGEASMQQSFDKELLAIQGEIHVGRGKVAL